MQFELPWELGPQAARYVLRDNADEAQLRVLVLSTLGAPERRRLRAKRAKKATSAEPSPVTTTRATVIRGHPTPEAQAKAWVKDPARHVAGELAVLNRVLALHRVAAADPGVREATLDQALVVRVGYGTGEEVADGRWSEAVEPPPGKVTRRMREASLRPQERLAALLGGRDAALACEELTLRARADLDAGRRREAALQLRVALEAALAELEAWRDRSDLADRLSELREERKAVGDAANAALRGGLDDDTTAAVERVVGRIEAALRARSAAGFAG